jgi:hypothetical protein
VPWPAITPDLGAERLDGVHLDVRHQFRQANHGADAMVARGIGDAAAVIAGRAAGDTALPRLRRQARQRVGRAADLEGADRLHGLELQEDLGPGTGGESGRGDERRLDGDALDSIPGGQHVGKYGELCHGRSG